MADAPRSTRDLRRFGLVLAAAFPVVFWLVLPWVFSRPRPWWPLAVAGVLLAFALLLPRALAPVERVWLRIGHALGWLNTRIILTILFYALVLPLGLFSARHRQAADRAQARTLRRELPRRERRLGRSRGHGKAVLSRPRRQKSV